MAASPSGAVAEPHVQTGFSSTPKTWFAAGLGAVACIALFKLALHLYAGKSYGYFVDELYFMACGRHLAWGYVDQPSLIALIARIEHVLFGDSLRAIRFFPALAGAGDILLAGLIARELGGRRYAQVLAALCVLFAPAYLSFNHYLSMNAFEPLFWMGCALIVIRVIKTGNQKLWLWFGVLAGIGLHNKHSMLFFCAGVAVGLLLTEHRRMLLKPWIWLGALIAFIIFLPNLVWNVQHHFPFLELMENIRRSGRNVSLTPFQFVQQQVSLLLTQSAPVWIAGLGFLMFHRDGRKYRVLAWTYLAVLAAFLLMHGRTYYLVPAYPMLFAAGGVVIESWLSRPRLEWAKPAYAAVIVLFGAMMVPVGVPVLPVETYLRYTKAMHMDQVRIENHDMGPLPQFYADMFGWEEMTAVAARAYNNLDPELRAKTAIFGGNFGQAGAIDLFGSRYGLPKAIGTHQNYWFWGPREYTGESVIVMGARREVLEPLFTSIEEVGRVYHPYSMPYEHFAVYHCRGSKRPLKDLWPSIKNWR